MFGKSSTSNSSEAPASPSEILFSELEQGSAFHAEGGTGKVFRSQYQGQAVVFKLPKEKGDVSYLGHEIRILSKLKPHPHLMTVVGIAIYSGFRVLVSEYISGINLGQFAKKQPSNFGQTLAFHQIFLKLATALNYIHSQLVIHGDLHDKNILITDQNQPVIIDFDLASVSVYNNNLYSERGCPVGRLGYVAPECFKPPFIYSAASDFYGFAITLVLCAMGDNEYYARTFEKVSFQFLAPISPPDILPLATKRLLISLFHPDRKLRCSGENVVETLSQICAELEGEGSALKLSGNV